MSLDKIIKLANKFSAVDVVYFKVMGQKLEQRVDKLIQSKEMPKKRK